MLFMVVWYIGEGKQCKTFSLPSPLNSHHNGKYVSTESTPSESADTGFSPEEWARMLKALDWPTPDQPITDIAMTTCPACSTFSILGQKEKYRVGDELYVHIVAKDHNNTAKRYGGDFFLTKLYSSELKASVVGEVLDHRNGSYSARFLLPWEGEAQVAVRLVHSSEVVQILKKCLNSNSMRRFYYGYFEAPGPNGKRIKETVTCNVKWGQADNSSTGTCIYRDPRTGDEWQCKKPKKLSCDAWVYHRGGGYRNPLTTFEKKLFNGALTNKGIKGDNRILNVLPSNVRIGATEKCKPGMPTPVPAGFYLEDVWTSRVCNIHHFKSADMEKCLKNKLIYMMGDSTTRQWFEFFETIIPSLKRVNIHTDKKLGPLMAIHMKNNIVLNWRAHGLPLSFAKMAVADLHYISNEIDGMAGGRDTIIVFDIFAHVVFHPLTFYAHRVSRIRQSVIALLKRAPETKVIIKSGNTRETKDVIANDWYYMQQNIIMKEAFRDLPVIYMDIFQMTSCHYAKEDVHPAPVIVANAIDIFLSFVCPV
ncbi:NXPE family member 3-like [Chanos chanos]|uniref:NXPE family member 3-like n=1 Tax=Chanos chanos TaxID=29144 RepID=A0A6J2UVX0_CHACN|nr:NXPE family member 3-like [Chanos chanos]